MNETEKNGKLFVVGTPIGNLSDFSPRGIETLENADYIAAEDTRITLRLLTHFGIKKPLLSYYKPKEQEKSGRIIELLSGGNSIALVSDAGMPCISDPGSFLVKKCRDLGISVEVIPGCNAAVAAVAASGLETDRWAFEGFLPVPKKERTERLDSVKHMPHTLVYYEAPHKLRQTLSDLAEALGADRQAAVCRELTKIHEETVRATLGEFVKNYENIEPRGEFVIVIEGAKSSENSENFTLEHAVQLARQLINGGEKLSDACKEAARITGISKRDIYSAVSEKTAEE